MAPCILNIGVRGQFLVSFTIRQHTIRELCLRYTGLEALVHECVSYVRTQKKQYYFSE
jgi:hypothetical protein